MTEPWTSETVIQSWNSMPRSVVEALEPDGGMPKRHLLNPTLLRMLGDVRGRRVLDAGCGNGYLSRILADLGAEVVGVEPAEVLLANAEEHERESPRGVTYVRADLTDLPELGEPFDAVVCSMVLHTIPDWQAAIRACVRAARPGGLVVVSINHPAFQQLWPTWRDRGEYRLRRYLEPYEIAQPYGVNFHRPLSAYLNAFADLGCRIREVAEPGLDPAIAKELEPTTPGIESYVHLPNFVIIAAEAAPSRSS